MGVCLCVLFFEESYFVVVKSICVSKCRRMKAREMFIGQSVKRQKIFFFTISTTTKMMLISKKKICFYKKYIFDKKKYIFGAK